MAKKKSTEEKAAPAKKRVPKEARLSSGSTLLNLACTDSPDWAFPAGKMINIIGDSDAGKTFLALTMLAEASIDSQFDGYDLVYDDIEAALNIPIGKYFGKRLADRLEIGNEEDGTRSDTIQNFFSNIQARFTAGVPFIYVMDSLDGLTSLEEEAYLKKVADSPEKEPGSYAMQKAKLLSQMLRNIVDQLEKSKSILIIISQTRDNLDPASFTKRTRSGGKALKFYASFEIWMLKRLSITNDKHKRKLGSEVSIHVTKNKYNGKDREVIVPIMYDLGVDDTTSLVNFLISTKAPGWSKSKQGMVECPMYKNSMHVKTLVNAIEDDDAVEDLRELASEQWQFIEEEIKLNRRSRYE